MAFTKAATIQDVPPGMGKQVSVNGKLIALFNANGAFYAVDDTCPHRGGPLSEGEVQGTEVTCPWHGRCSSKEHLTSMRKRKSGASVQGGPCPPMARADSPSAARAWGGCGGFPSSRPNNHPGPGALRSAAGVSSTRLLPGEPPGPLASPGERPSLI